MTDHQPLKWLMELDKLIVKLARWALLLQEYNFEVVHKTGVKKPGWHASAYLAWMEGGSGQTIGDVAPKCHPPSKQAKGA